MKNAKLKAVEAFETDFNQFQIDNMALIGKVHQEIRPALDKKVLEDFFIDQVDECRESLIATAAGDVEDQGGGPHEVKKAATQCHEWIIRNLGGAGDLILIALTLYLNGRKDGQTMILEAAKRT